MQGSNVMKVGFDPRKLCRWLFILTQIACSASQNCTDDSECGPLAECYHFITSTEKICACKYGGSRPDKNGRLKPCLNHCMWDHDCPSYAECVIRLSGNQCKCKYGGPIYSGDELTSCQNYCTRDSDCTRYAECDIHSSENRCKCKYGRPIYKGDELTSCNNYCSSNEDCPKYAECEISLSGNWCKCKYGGPVYSGVYVIDCDNHCDWNDGCPSFAECDFRLSGYRCKCKYGGATNNGGEVTSCNDHCTRDAGCASFADCDVNSSGNRCRCKYGGSSYSGDKLTSCYFPTWEISVGVSVGLFIFALIGIKTCYYVRHRRLLRQANSGTVGVQPTPILQHSPMPSYTTQPIYPIQQYREAAPPDQELSNHGYGYSQPASYSPEQHN